MKNIRNIRINTDSEFATTVGLKRFVGYEIRVLIKELKIDQYIDVLSFIINYFVDFKPVINNGQTIAYYSWLLQFVIVKEEIVLYEVKPDGTGYAEGVDDAYNVVFEQLNECSKHNATPLFPLFNQMVVVSKGVFEMKSIDAVRYPSPSHMTGWWLTTDLYDDNVKSLETIHYYHLAFKRPDILKFMALPFGYRFFLDKQTEVWFDQETLT